MTTAGIAIRQTHKPRPYLQLTAGNVRESAVSILWRLDELHRSRACGAHLFIDPTGRVFVVGEETGAAVQWCRDHADWHRGLFRAGCGIDVLVDELT